MKNVLEFFETTVSRFPEKVGFTDEKRKATFTEVRNNAKAIGSFLCDSGSRRPVAVLIDKTVNCIDAMLGTLYADDFYVVVDVHSPKDRIVNILATLEQPLVITDGARNLQRDSVAITSFMKMRLRPKLTKRNFQTLFLLCAIWIRHIFFSPRVLPVCLRVPLSATERLSVILTG